MTRYVLDASAAVEYLLRTPLGLALADTISDAELAAPDLVDPEVLSVLRRAVLQDRLSLERATMAVDDLVRMPLQRIPASGLARRAWRFRESVSAYDSFYVAAADAHGAPLLTTDGRLARAPALGIAVQHLRVA
ncbi:type II toxin-antitoxin system VapC family toxin [Candidatus Poriferisodalis sp.]|uniref:type II toxin-antitoxin system VapC family toxin n=1 Tax=Candidatus Poriferisodalis sp. TaxID=3101277 RepID=UPI003B02443C